MSQTMELFREIFYNDYAKAFRPKCLLQKVEIDIF